MTVDCRFPLDTQPHREHSALMTNTARNMFNRDLEAMLALSDARKAENAQRRAACRANAELVAVLSAEASRRGQSEIDWAEYFRNTGING